MGSRFYMSLPHECSTASRTRTRKEGEDPSGGKEVACVVMEETDPRIPLYNFLQPVLSETTALTIQGFQGLPK